VQIDPPPLPQQWGPCYLANPRFAADLSGAGLAVARSADRAAGLVRFDAGGTAEPFGGVDMRTEWAIPSRDFSKMLVKHSSDTRLAIQEAGSDEYAPLQGLRPGEVIAAALVDVDSTEVAIALIRSDSGTDVQTFRLDRIGPARIAGTVAATEGTVRSAQIDVLGRAVWTANQESMTRWTIRRYTFGPAVTDDRGNDLVLVEAGWVRVIEHTPRHVVSVGRDRVVVVSEANRVLFWEHGKRVLEDVTPDGWPIGDVTIVSDSRHYLAVFDWTAGQLSTWRIARSGRIREVPGRNGKIHRLDIARAVNKGSVAVHRGGVIAAMGATLVGWSFPVRADDD
jgi:hypothetical protein